MVGQVWARILDTERVEWSDGRHLQQAIVTDLAAAIAGRRITLLYPGERVHCFTLQAPDRRRTAWLKALPYTLEDQLAEEVEHLHIVHGSISKTGQLPVLVTARQPLTDLVQSWHSHRMRIAQIVPDFFCLPWHTGQCTVWPDRERILIRYSPSAGCACDAENLLLYLNKILVEQNNVQQLRVIGSLANSITALEQSQEAVKPWYELAAKAPPPPLTLNLSDPTRLDQHYSWRSVAILSGISLLLLLAQSVSEWQQLHTTQQRLQEEVTAVFRSMLPNTRLVNPRAQIEGLLKQNPATDQQAVFLPLLGVAGAILQQYPQINLKSLNFRAGKLELDLEGGSLEQMDTLKTALSQHSELVVELRASVRQGKVLGRLAINFASLN